MKYGSFGDIVFEVYEYYAHNEENTYIYARQQTIQPPSTTQWLGRELQKIRMKLKFHYLLSNPAESYKKLKEIAQKGEAQKLIIAEQVLGDFVIDKINAEYTQVNTYGQPVAIELDIELTEYAKKELQKTRHKRGSQGQKKKQKNATQKTQQQQGSKPKAIITKEGAKK
ncbi:phage tail protein [Pampinifervens florentissimum]|uniref:phage tail protein n=1 Tax=Pampinifervens florentissimum TaxID=1632019 RepID=UPI0013B4811A|nr:phage tail protein [Hydrogenobacter sp. T-8]QID32332.1 phage tail protein [Hydrogenobacter sp. T-8]